MESNKAQVIYPSARLHEDLRQFGQQGLAMGRSRAEVAASFDGGGSVAYGQCFDEAAGDIIGGI